MSCQACRSARPARSPGRSCPLAGVAAAKQEVVIRVKSGRGTPLLLCHGDFCGWGFYGFRLAELLKDSGPVYLLHSVLDPAAGSETIEETVRRYLAQNQ